MEHIIQRFAEHNYRTTQSYCTRSPWVGITHFRSSLSSSHFWCFRSFLRCLLDRTPAGSGASPLAETSAPFSAVRSSKLMAFEVSSDICGSDQLKCSTFYSVKKYEKTQPLFTCELTMLMEVNLQRFHWFRPSSKSKFNIIYYSWNTELILLVYRCTPYMGKFIICLYFSFANPHVLFQWGA